jgi:adenine-specific DNA-methyltransferase
VKSGQWQQNWTDQHKFHEAAAALRKRQTKSETLLWEALPNRKLEGRKFRRQYPMGMYILDFYCVEEKLAIEIDGRIHETQQEADNVRQETLELAGVRFLRFTADTVESDLANVLIAVKQAFTDK